MTYAPISEAPRPEKAVMRLRSRLLGARERKRAE